MFKEWFAAAAVGVVAFLGASTTNDHRPPRDLRGESSTTREAKLGANFNIACVAAAVAARESALGAAVSTHSASVSAAYAARASALLSAYSQTGNDTIRKAVKNAWKQFAGATRAAKKGWQFSREAAWQSFRTAIKSCGNGASSVADHGNAGSEMSGQ